MWGIVPDSLIRSHPCHGVSSQGENRLLGKWRPDMPGTRRRAFMTAPQNNLIPRSEGESLAWLTDELQAARSRTLRVALLLEISRRERNLGQIEEAGRRLLAAAREEPSALEPLEELFGLLSADTSEDSANLDKLFERMSRAAQTQEERALVELRTAISNRRSGNDEAAKRALERALQADPKDAGAWALSERFAKEADDGEARVRALMGRARLCEDAEWRTVLLLALAKECANEDLNEPALDSLVQATKEAPTRGLLGMALLRLEELAEATGNGEELAETRERIARFLAAADPSEPAETEPAPPAPQASQASQTRQTTQHVAWLRATLAWLENDTLSRARAALENAGNSPDVLEHRRRLALIAGDSEEAERSARALLDVAPNDAPHDGKAAVRLQLAAAGDADAISALLDPNDPDHLSGAGWSIAFEHAESGVARAELFERFAEWVDTKGAKRRAWLNAAFEWTAADNKERASVALSRLRHATDATTDDDELALRHWFASHYPETASAAKSARSETHPPNATETFETLRRAALDGDRELALELATEFPLGADKNSGQHADPAALIRDVLLAAPDDDRSAAFENWASRSTDPNQERALRWLAAVLGAASGETADASRALDALHEEIPHAEWIAKTRLAAHALATGKEADKATTRQTVEQMSQVLDERRGLPWRATGALLEWHHQSGDRERAAQELSDLAKVTTSAKFDALAMWARRANALRTASPNDPFAALETASGGKATDHPLDAARALDRRISAAVQDDDEPAAAAFVRSHVLSARRSGDATVRISAAHALARSEPGLASQLEELAVRRAGDGNGARDAHETQALSNAWDAVCTTLSLSLSLGQGELIRATRRILGDETALAKTAAPVELLKPESEAARLTNLESAPAGTDPRVRARALSESARELAAANPLAAWNLLAAGELDAARSLFSRVAKSDPESPLGFVGLRAVANAAGDMQAELEAEACLARLSENPASELEQIGVRALESLDDPAVAEALFNDSLSREPHRRGPFDRVLRLAAARDDFTRMRALLESRLRLGLATDDGAALNWQLASVCWRLHDAEGAERALAEVIVRAPTHAEALSASAERALANRSQAEKSGTNPGAAAALMQVALNTTAPKALRTAAAVRAADLLQEMPEGRSGSAKMLEKSFDAGLADQALLERLVVARAAREDWVGTCEALEQLRSALPGPTELTTLRLELALRRDRIADAAGAATVAKLVLERDPDDSDALECVLATEPTGLVAASALKSARSRCEASLRNTPEDTSLMARYLSIARHAGDAELEFVVSESLRACGVASGTAKMPRRAPTSRLSDNARESLNVSGNDGPWGELMSTLAPALTTVLGPTLRELNLGRRDRVRNSAELPVLAEIEPWLDALGLGLGAGSIEVYLGGPEAERVYCVAESTPILVIGEAVRAPLGRDTLCAVARELFALDAGSLCLCHRKQSELELVLASLRALAGSRDDEPPTAPSADADPAYVRELKRAMPRRSLRRACDQLREADASGQTLADWAAAETLRFARVATVATGSVRQALTSTYADDDSRLSHRRSLLLWVWEGHLARVRAELGMEGE